MQKGKPFTSNQTETDEMDQSKEQNLMWFLQPLLHEGESTLNLMKKRGSLGKGKSRSSHCLEKNQRSEKK